MTSNVPIIIVSRAVALLALRVKRQHYATEDGWCAYCWTFNRTRVRHGRCEPWQRAERITMLYREQNGSDELPGSARHSQH